MVLESSLALAERRSHRSPVLRGPARTCFAGLGVARRRLPVITGVSGIDLGRQPGGDLVPGVAVELGAQQQARDSPEQYSQ